MSQDWLTDGDDYFVGADGELLSPPEAQERLSAAPPPPLPAPQRAPRSSPRTLGGLLTKLWKWLT